MIKKFTQFWIENAKVTVVLILIMFFSGIGSYILISKQYNPDIPVPAFNIIVPAPGFSAKEVENLVVEPLEDKIAEIKDIDHIYGVSRPNFWVVNVKFEVWTNKEKATTRLYNKIFENLSNKPLWVQDPIIKKMDSDDFPIYTFAIVRERSKKWKNNSLPTSWNSSDLITLRKVALDIANKLKFIPWTSVFYLVWGYEDNLNVILDLDKLKAKNIDIMQVYQAIKKNNVVFPWWELKLNKTQSTITVNGNLADVDKLKKLIVWVYNNKPVYLQEVAYIFKWIPEKKYYTFVSDEKKSQFKDAVFIGIAKKKSENAVVLSKKIKAKLKELEKTLPAWYKIIEVADQWKVAADATNDLLLNLIESIIIVFIVLLVYLWLKDAINNAFAIPLVLLTVFLIAFVIWDNINRIVLFALVLALWMLVDNSTVVIENIAKHLKKRSEEIRKDQENKNIPTIKETILSAVDEVWNWIVLSTITRILSLIAMFFVTGMMGQYMWWVPKYVVISLLVSLFIAFSVNPFIAYFLAKREENKLSNNKIVKNKKTGEHKIYKIYEKFLATFLWEKNKIRRKLFKILFWLSLIFVVIIFPSRGIFRMWMLPKDNRDQIYIWIDWQRNWSVKKSKEVATYVDKILSKFKVRNTGYIEDDKIIKNISYWIWIAPVIDFSNAFRWIANRRMSYQISLRVNLVDKDRRKISSIDWTLKFRNYLEKEIRKKYPDAKIRVLEDPPGPPVRASFMLKIQWDRSINYKDLESLAKRLKDKLKPILKKDQVVDLYTTRDTYKTDYRIQIDHQLLSSYWLDLQQIVYTIYNIFKGSNISIIHDYHTKEPINIYLSVLTGQKYNVNIFNNITFMNKKGQKVYLKQFAKLEKTNLEHTIYTEDKYKTVYIYWELWDNSIVYPANHVTFLLKNNKFWEWKFKVISWNPYEINIKSTKTWQIFKIAWGGERELSLDTFRDLWTAMIMALIAIYFLMVAQFKSFRIAWVIMMTFLLGLFGVIPWFGILHIIKGQYFVSPSMIWLIALAGIVVWNAIILIEYVNLLLRNWYSKKNALIEAWKTRMKAIIITSMTTVFWSMTILSDPVWGWLWRSIVWGLSVSAALTLILIPIFLYDVIECKNENTDVYCKMEELVELEKIK